MTHPKASARKRGERYKAAPDAAAEGTAPPPLPGAKHLAPTQEGGAGGASAGLAF